MAARRPTYELNQCALYKVGSKSRLAELLNTSVKQLLELEASPKYRVFPLEETVCPFTGKITKERWVQEPHGPQRTVHERIQTLLMRVTPPSYAHAAVKGRSYRTNAMAHISGDCVATFDITKFYPSTPEKSVFDFFAKRMGCAPDIAGLLTNLTCYKPPGEGGRTGLPTGSPVSPILSVYANQPMFDALSQLASKFGLVFTCYVDDLTFSGPNVPVGLARMIKSIVERHGHKMSEGKTRFYARGEPKHVTGVVLKDGRLQVPFGRFLKARRIQMAINAEKDPAQKLVLSRKLAGLLGEAAFLDPRFTAWAQSSYSKLSAAHAAANAI